MLTSFYKTRAKEYSEKKEPAERGRLRTEKGNEGRANIL